MIFCDVPRFPVIQDVSRPLLSHLFGGKDTKAGGEETNASGEGTRASGEDTRAGGEGTRASGEDTRAAGEDTRAGNDDTRALPPHVSSSSSSCLLFFLFLHPRPHYFPRLFRFVIWKDLEPSPTKNVRLLIFYLFLSLWLFLQLT